MTGRIQEEADAAARSAARLTRGITATWWYTVSGVLTFEVMVVVILTGSMFAAEADAAPVAIVGLGGLVWCAATVMLLLQYRHRGDGAPIARWRSVLAPLLISVAYGVAAGLMTGLWTLAALPMAQLLVLLNWPPGVRLRATLAVTAALAALWMVDTRTLSVESGIGGEGRWWMLGFFSMILPAMSVLSLWWWDVLVTLDRARAAEARLGATQERLRVATDVHDLQGHHLQVIALQLELAERLMSKDPDAALEQLRAARTSVDEARQGTRDLATRFRSVPLPDELANAVDLLRAAGTTADAVVDPDAAHAPASVLGPVIRETTTNVLRHGGGRWARLRLSRDGAAWVYEIANDSTDAAASADGSGLEGISRRVAEAGGSLEVQREKQEFRVIVTVPISADTDGAARQAAEEGAP